jgi:chorismate synthase
MLRFLTAGESHGPELVGIIEGLPAGLAVSSEAIAPALHRRQAGYGRSGRQHIEHDEAEILTGVTDGLTTGAPVTLRIINRDYANQQARPRPPLTVPRPGHADLVGALKYGFDNLRLVSERSSARETAMRVAVGAVAQGLLSEFGVTIGSCVQAIGGVQATIPQLPWPEVFALAERSDVRCPDAAAAEAMRHRIDEARQHKDTAGGVIVVVATGVPIGLGSYVHWDRRLDGRLAAAVMSIQAIKGVEIGDGFALAVLAGTEAQDPIVPGAGVPGWARPSNHAGGTEGGVSNGQPIIVRAAMKPIPTTATAQPSIDLATGQAAPSEYLRSDNCAVPAAGVVAEAMVAWVLAEALVEKLGGDSLAEMKRRAAGLRYPAEVTA